jgi:hypothetical protein
MADNLSTAFNIAIKVLVEAAEEKGLTVAQTYQYFLEAGAISMINDTGMTAADISKALKAAQETMTDVNKLKH